MGVIELYPFTGSSRFACRTNNIIELGHTGCIVVKGLKEDAYLFGTAVGSTLCERSLERLNLFFKLPKKEFFRFPLLRPRSSSAIRVLKFKLY